MSNPPAFQLYVGDFMSDPLVDVMSPEELGGYFRLLLVAWKQPEPGYLPDDPSLLASWSRLGKRWGKCGIAVLRCFRRLDDGRLYQKRMVEVAKQQAEFHLERSIAGKAGNAKRWATADNKTNDTSQSDGKAIANTIANGRSLSSSPVFLSPARARVIGAFQGFGVLTPDASTTVEVVRKVETYAEASGSDPAETADKAMGAFDRISESWPVKRRTPALFLKHWDAIQEVMGGANPTPKANPRAPPEPKQRQYEDLGDVAKRLGGDG